MDPKSAVSIKPIVVGAQLKSLTTSTRSAKNAKAVKAVTVKAAVAMVAAMVTVNHSTITIGKAPRR